MRSRAIAKVFRAGGPASLGISGHMVFYAGTFN